MSQTEPTILILGSLREFTPLVRLAKERGFRALVVDGNPGTEAKKLADVALDLDVRDTDAIAAAARREGASAITTAYSDLLFECAVRIAEKAGLPYHLGSAALPLYRDKSAMKEVMNRLGIRNAKSALLGTEADSGALRALNFPVVLKPLDLYGSRGLRVARNMGEAAACADEIRRAFPACTTLLAEEYEDGYECNIQCFVHEGQVHVLGICDREKTPCAPGQIPLSTRNIYPSRLTEDVLCGAADILTAYIRATGQTRGPLAMQFFFTPGRGISVGEIAARFLGYEHELLRDACAVSIEELLLAEARRDEAEIARMLSACRPRGTASAAVLYFHAKDGILADESAAERIAAHPAVRLFELFYRPGERIGSPQRMPYFARYNITAPTREEVDRISEELIGEMSATDADGRELVWKNRLGRYGS